MKKMILGLGLMLASSLSYADIDVQDAKVRAVPPTQKITAAFMQLTNTGTENRSVVSASSPASDVVELHTHIQEGDRMQMRQIPEIKLPAGETTTLQPGGLHLMLIGLKAPVVEGDQLSITLTLDNGERVDLELPVQPVMPGMKGGHQGMHPKH